MRTPKPAPPFNEQNPPWHDPRIHLDLTLRFLSPVIGGGVTSNGPRKPADPITPVRPSSIRGQLRFWWRAINLHKLTNADCLRMKEKEVFGGISDGPQKSSVAVVVTKQPGNPKPLAIYEARNKPKPGMQDLAYGAFTINGTEKVREPGNLHDYSQTSFDVRLSFEVACETDVLAAVWGWLNFGGLGARTRRGFGAIGLVKATIIRPESTALTEPKTIIPPLQEGWKQWVSPVNCPWPHLEAMHEVRALSNPGQEFQVLKGLLKRFKNFRQSRQGQRGPSHWPEPDAIRGKSDAIQKFPRAQLGLPIVFFFKGESSHNTTLSATGKARWASPVIIRPYRPYFSDYDERGLIVTLAGPQPDALLLDPPKTEVVQSQLLREEAKRIVPMNGETDVVKRLIQFMTKDK